MRIYLARHGHAVPEGRFLPDDYRYLSARGRASVRGVAGILAQRGERAQAILTSPLTRAVQTAELLAGGLGFEGTVESDVGLLPGAHAQAMANTIAQRADRIAALVVVGHMPTISALGAQLIGRPGFPPLKPGHVLVLDRGEPLYKIDPDRLEVETLLLA